MTDRSTARLAFLAASILALAGCSQGAGAWEVAGGGSTVDLGTTPLGTLVRHELVLRNVGEGPVTVEAEGLTPPFGASPAQVTIPAGEQRKLALTFAPTAWGRFDGAASLVGGGQSFEVRLRGATPPSPCQPLLESARADFGSLRLGTTSARAITIRNDGESPCPLAASVEGEAFSLDWAPAEIPPGVATSLVVSFHPQAEAAEEGWLALDIAGATPRLPLLGEGVARCGALGEQALEFGAAVPSCSADPQGLTLINRCAQELEFQSIEILDSPQSEHWVRARPALPYPLAPDASLAVALGYRPKQLGPDASQVEVVFAGEPPLRASLTGTGSIEGSTVSDVHVQPPGPAADVLLVIDGSVSLDPWASRLDAWLETLVSELVPYRGRIGVTSTSLLGTADCPGEAGRLVPVDGERERMVDAVAPDALETLRANVAQVLACSTASEGAALEAARRALSLADAADDPQTPEPDDGNLGLRREDAELHVVLVSARDDFSPSPVADYASAFAEAGLHALAGGCGVLPAPRRLAELGAELHPICDDPWTGLFPWEGEKPRRHFQLRRTPFDLDDDGTIEPLEGEVQVRIDGVPVPPDGALPWWYEPRLVVFSALPPADSTIEILYAGGCP